MYRARPVLFLVVSAIPYLILAILLAVLGVGFAGSFAGGLDATPDASDLDPALVSAALTFGLAFVLIAIVVFSVQSAALVHAASERYHGRETTIGESLRVGLRASPRVIIAGFLVFILGPTAVVVAAALTQQAVILVVAALAAIFLFFFLITSWMLVPVVATIEGAGPVQALVRSWRLATGSRWRVLGLLALLVVLQGVISVLFRSEEHTSELQSRLHLVCRLLLEKKKSKRLKPAPLLPASAFSGMTCPVPVLLHV